MAENDPTLAARFWARVSKGGPDQCWPWQGPRAPKGYGCVFIQGPRGSAHRFAWTQQNGPIPAGLMVLHHCDNPPCCNPAHLFLGTAGDNARDAYSKGRCSLQIKAPRAAHGESHTFAKVTEEDVLRMRALYASGFRIARIAEQYPCLHLAHVGKIIRRRNWKHVP